MADNIEVGEHRVDRMSQKMLVAMEEGPKRATELQRQADIDNYGKLSHRMDEQLKPAGLVQEMNTVHRKFRLTDEGKAFVDEHNLEVRTLDEIREVAIDARTRTQSLSGTVGSLSSTVDDLKESHDEREEMYEQFNSLQAAMILDADSQYNSSNEPRWLPKQNFDVIKERSVKMQELSERMDELENQMQKSMDKLDGLRQSFVEHCQDVKMRDEEVDQQIVELAERIEDLRDDLDELQDESISDLEEEIEEMQKGRLSSLFG